MKDILLHKMKSTDTEDSFRKTNKEGKKLTRQKRK